VGPVFVLDEAETRRARRFMRGMARLGIALAAMAMVQNVVGASQCTNEAVPVRGERRGRRKEAQEGGAAG